jgi:dTDP-4-amino-4,6-dideoxygalactose transaminase
MRHLQARGVGFSVHYPVALPFSRYHAASIQPAVDAFPVARWIAAQTLSLPCGPHLGLDDMDAIADAVVDFFKKG